MEIQIPLVLFVAFCAASAGIFATQAVLALRNDSNEIQLPALVASVAALAIGGISVLFHLAQPLHIFNGFGNLTSGITQELIVIVLLIIVMVVYFAMIRRNEGKVPSWCAVAAIVASLALDLVCAHSYMMAARPAWDSVLQVLSVLGGSLAIGPAVVAVICGLKKTECSKGLSMLVLGGTIAGAVLMLAYLCALAATSGSLSSMGTYIDPTNPTAPVFDTASVSPFSGSALPSTCLAVLASLGAVAAGFAGKKFGKWAVWGSVAVACALIAVISLRVTFYILGVSVYNFYGITG